MYLMELFYTFQTLSHVYFFKFKTMAKCQYDTYIKIVQCDGTGEVIPLAKLFFNLGVNFKHFFAHSSEQNAWLRVVIEELLILLSHFFSSVMFLRHIGHILLGQLPRY